MTFGVGVEPKEPKRGVAPRESESFGVGLAARIPSIHKICFCPRCFVRLSDKLEGKDAGRRRSCSARRAIWSAIEGGARDRAFSSKLAPRSTHAIQARA